MKAQQRWGQSPENSLCLILRPLHFPSGVNLSSATILNPKAARPSLSPFKFSSCSSYCSPWLPSWEEATVPPQAFLISPLFFFPLSCPLPVFLSQIHYSALLAFYPRETAVHPLSGHPPPLFCLISMASLRCPPRGFSPPQRLLLESTMTGEQSSSQAAASPQQSLAWGLCKHLRRQKSTFLDPAPGFPARAHNLHKLLAYPLEGHMGW